MSDKSDKLAIISEVIAQHQTISDSLSQTGVAANDLEAICSLQKEYSGWVLGSTEAVAEKRKKLEETLASLDRGLTRHFGFEERVLPPFFGGLLMHALELEHQAVRSEIAKVRALVTDTRLEELGQQELLSGKWQLQRAVSNLTQVVDEHKSKEEVVLKMAREALEGPGAVPPAG